MDEFLQELKQSLNANAVKTIERLEEKHKASLDFARTAVKLAEKMNVCDLVNENARLQKELRFLKAQSGPEPVKKKDLQVVPPSFVPQENMDIHCRTKEEAKALLNHLYHLGYVWHSGKSLLSATNFKYFGQETCYCIYPNGYQYDHEVAYTNVEATGSKTFITFDDIPAYVKSRENDLEDHRIQKEQEER